MINKGQSTNVWTNEWEGLTPNSEIQMWDYYGGRQWISKYTPRKGKVLEAGCGLGRYVFYFSKFGIDIEGIDFSNEIIEYLNNWQKKYGFNCAFIEGDVTNLPYLNDTLSGYISLGVIEHFINGPDKVLKEALRVLKPGGVAIITTPNKSFWVRYNTIKKKLKNIIKKIIGRSIIQSEFFQYEYTTNQLKRFLKKEGFYVSRAENCDLLYPFLEISNFTGKNIYNNSFAVKFSRFFENTVINTFAAQSITISIKTADLMHCFLCGELKCHMESIKKYDVPICSECEKNNISKNYLRNKTVKYSSCYDINPQFEYSIKKICEISGKEYETDVLFENFGFNKNVHPELLLNPGINIELCCNNIQPIWRKKKPLQNDTGD